MSKILGTYQITYPDTTDVVQTKDLILHDDYLNIIVPTKKEISLLESSPMNKKIEDSDSEETIKEKNTIFDSISDAKAILKPFGSNYFTTESPLGKAINSGYLDLNMPYFKKPMCCIVSKI